MICFFAVRSTTFNKKFFATLTQEAFGPRQATLERRFLLLICKYALPNLYILGRFDGRKICWEKQVTFAPFFVFQLFVFGYLHLLKYIKRIQVGLLRLFLIQSCYVRVFEVILQFGGAICTIIAEISPISLTMFVVHFLPNLLQVSSRLVSGGTRVIREFLIDRKEGFEIALEYARPIATGLRLGAQRLRICELGIRRRRRLHTGKLKMLVNLAYYQAQSSEQCHNVGK